MELLAGSNDLLFAWTGPGIDIFLTGTTAKTVLSNCVITHNTNVHSYGGGINISSLGPWTPRRRPPRLRRDHELRDLQQPRAGDAEPEPPASRTNWARVAARSHRLLGNHNVTITDSRISGNTTPGPGGGIGIIMNHGTVAIHNSMIGGAQLPARPHGLRQHGRPAGRRHQRQWHRRPDRDLIDQGKRHPEQRRGHQHCGLRAGLGRRHSERQQREPVDSCTLSKVTIIGNSVSPMTNSGGGGGILCRGQPDGGLLPGSWAIRAGLVGGLGLRVDNGGPGMVIATNNWWGWTDGPSAAPCDTASLDGSGREAARHPQLQPLAGAAPGRQPQFSRAEWNECADRGLPEQVRCHDGHPGGHHRAARSADRVRRDARRHLRRTGDDPGDGHGDGDLHP